MAHGSSATKNLKSGFIDFTAGFLGGVALVYVGQPLDTVKVKMQTFPHLYSNMVQCTVNTLKTDGVYRGLYAGTVPALIANVAENSVLFLGYGFCQKLMAKVTGTQRIEELSTLSNASAGCLASFFSSLVLTPTELVKCKLQAMYEVQKAEAAKGNVVERIGPGRMAARIFREEGVNGLFRGLLPTIAREMPGYFFFFGGYEGVRALLCKEGQTKDDIGILGTMTAGAVGGMVFWTTTYPADVVKSRVQVDPTLNGHMHTLMIQIARREGIGALYNGLMPTLVRTIPATATLFVTYEYTKQFLHRVLA